MTKLRATAVHFMFSCFFVISIVALMSFVWFPSPLLEVLGGHGLLLLIGSADVVLGPLLTFIVFRSGKKGLTFDLIVIACCQISALFYGISTIAAVRPVYIVYVKDRFELVRKLDISADSALKAQSPEFHPSTWTGPKLIGVEFPKSSKEQLELINSSLGGGPDIHLLPQFYADYAHSKPSVAKKAQPLAALKALNPNEVTVISGMAERYGRSPEHLGFLPFRAIREDITMIVDVRTGESIAAVKLKPW